MSGKKWLKGAIKRPGSLRAHFGLKDGDGPIPKAKLDALIAELKAKDDRTEAETRLLKKAILARTMSRF